MSISGGILKKKKKKKKKKVLPKNLYAYPLFPLLKPSVSRRKIFVIRKFTVDL
jgi:hypothetical protein